MQDVERAKALGRAFRSLALLKRLGFRVTFVFGLLPLTYHPALFVIVPVGVAAWLLEPALTMGGTIPWQRPLWLWLGLGAVLSIPIIGWFLVALRLHLLQAVMPAAAMAMLGWAVARGEAPPALALLPAAFFGAHLALAVLGRAVIARDRRAAAEVAAAAAAAGTGAPPSVLLDDTVGVANDSRGSPQAILEAANLPMVHAATRGRDSVRLWARVDRAALAAATALIGPRQRDGLFADDPARQRGDHGCIAVPVAAVPIDAVRVAAVAALPPRALLLRGRRARVTATARGRSAVEVVFGRLAPVAWWPGFCAFGAVQLSGDGGRMVWHFGFVPGPVQAFGAADEAAAIAQAIAPWRSAAQLSAGVQLADGAPLLLMITAHDEAALAALLADPAGWQWARMQTLRDAPERYANRAEALCTAFQAAKAADAAPALVAIAELLAALPAPDFARIAVPLLACLNSHKVSRAPLGRTVRFAAGAGVYEVVEAGRSGFDLVRKVPALYARLGELGEPARRYIEAIGKAEDWPEALVAARAALGSAPGG